MATASSKTGSPDEDADTAHVIEQLQNLNTRAQGPLFPARILTNSLIFDNVLDFASPGTILRLQRTCRAANDLVQPYINRAFNINHSLKRFFSNPPAFRSLQAETGTLISGSFALQFFERTIYIGSDMDLYCFYGDREQIGLWLIEQEGYVFVPNSRQNQNFRVAVGEAPDMELNPYSRMRGISTVYTFTKPSGCPEDDLCKVQLIVTYRSPMEAVLNFHSTTVMNVIAYNYAYALYPRATFEERMFLFCGRHVTHNSNVFEKYRSRGFLILHELPATHPAVWKIGDPRMVPTGSRWLGDRHTWSVPLSVVGVEPPPAFSPISSPLTSDPCLFTSWNFGVTHTLTFTDTKLRCRVGYEVIGGDSFVYAYVCAPGPVGEELEAIMDRVERAHTQDTNPNPGGEEPDTLFLDEELLQEYKREFL